jgi:hypothetical protein
LTSVLEKLKALDAQRAQLLDGAKKEALDNAERAVAELNELGFHYTLTEDATANSTSAAESPLQSPTTPSERRSLSDLPFQNDPASRWSNASVTKDKEAVHGRGAYGAPPN